MSKPKKSKIVEPLKLDFGAGNRPQPGYKSVDLHAPQVDYRVDLCKFPFPWKDNTVDEIVSSHFLEHIPRDLRWPFFNECYRVLKLDGAMKIVVPSFKSDRAYGDMTHEMPPIVPMFFFYLNKAWRETNLLTYGPYAEIKCNFEHACGPTGVNPAFAQRTQEVQQFACNHYWESFPDLWATLTKKPM
jgi:hypothetical protein